MFTLYRIVKRSVAENVPDKASVHTRNARNTRNEAVTAPEQYWSALLLKQSAENRRKEYHGFCLLHAVILISNVRMSASKKMNLIVLIWTLTIPTTTFERTKEKFCGFWQPEVDKLWIGFWNGPSQVWTLFLVNRLLKSEESVANCMTDRVSVHTGNASEQFLYRSRTLSLVHTVPEQLLKRSKNLCEHRLSLKHTQPPFTGATHGTLDLFNVSELTFTNVYIKRQR